LRLEETAFVFSLTFLLLLFREGRAFPTQQRALISQAWPPWLRPKSNPELINRLQNIRNPKEKKKGNSSNVVEFKVARPLAFELQGCILKSVIFHSKSGPYFQIHLNRFVLYADRQGNKETAKYGYLKGSVC